MRILRGSGIMWIVWISIGFIALFFLVGLLASILFRNKKRPHRLAPDAYGIPFSEIIIPAASNGKLYGWWIPGSDNAPVLILMHGWNSNLGRFLPYIRKLHPLGYNLLALDARSHGSSSSIKNPTVWSFTEDIHSALDYLFKEFPEVAKRIGVIGHSIGGGAAINAASQDARIQSVIGIGAFSHPIQVMKQELRSRHIPFFPFAWLFFKYWGQRVNLDYDRIAPVNNIRDVKGKILLIHSRDDRIVPISQARDLMRSADSGKAELWEIQGYGHNDYSSHNQFWNRVTAFLRDTLGPIDD